LSHYKPAPQRYGEAEEERPPKHKSPNKLAYITWKAFSLVPSTSGQFG